ncbi:MAG: translation initiation factor 2 [Desulfovibrio sp.]|jgi:hypothetical protein|nr:translation initiation factor 2 [Desulfovibrio sp.]
MRSTDSFPRRHLLADGLFLFFVAVYALAYLSGVVPLSAGGAVLDSDLCLYAQNMAGEDHPDLFVNDSVLCEGIPYNRIWTLLTFFAKLFTPGDDYGLGLLRSGALTIFLHFAAYYFLGRRLFGCPSLALLLSVVMGVTVYVGFGTFWGVMYSDPVPRVLYAALWPFLLLAALRALDSPAWRPIVMLFAGIGIYVQSVSALTVGAMLFMAFFLHVPGARKYGSHSVNCALCLLLFFIPVLSFLWPSYSKEWTLSSADLDILRQLLNRRFAQDFGAFGESLVRMFSYDNSLPQIFCGGFFGWLIVMFRGQGLARKLAKMYPGFLLGIAFAVFCSWAEAKWAMRTGHLQFGYELMRSLRFLVPLSWLMALSAIACFWPSLYSGVRFLIVAATVSGILLLSHDRQQLAIVSAFSQGADISLPLREEIREGRRSAELYREALERLHNAVPVGEPVFGNGDYQAVRYLAMRPLVHSFRDGYYYYYKRDVPGARDWLRYTAMMENNPTGYIEAWRDSGARWLLSDRSQDKALLMPYGDIFWENAGWIIARKR